MSVDSEKLIEKALELTDSERADIAASLIDSLDTTVDPDAELQWEQEILRRVDDLRNGRVKTIPWPEVRKKLLEDL